MFSSFKNRSGSNTERLLQEFPWLWAIQPTWSLSPHGLRVHTLDPNSGIIHNPAGLLSVGLYEMWWAKVDLEMNPWPHVERVVWVPTEPSKSVAECVVRAIDTSKYQVRYLVQKSVFQPMYPDDKEGRVFFRNLSSSVITIYRAPKGADLNQMCRSFGLPKETTHST
jgi:hypothetical protein